MLELGLPRLGCMLHFHLRQIRLVGLVHRHVILFVQRHHGHSPLLLLSLLLRINHGGIEQLCIGALIEIDRVFDERL